MLREDVSSFIFESLAMTRLEVERRFPGPLSGQNEIYKNKVKAHWPIYIYI